MRYAFAIGLAVLLAGCAVEVASTAATQGVAAAQGAKSALGSMNAATAQLGKTKIESALKAYKVATGSYPESLDDLVPDYLPVMSYMPDGSSFGYDPETGEVTK